MKKSSGSEVMLCQVDSLKPSILVGIDWADREHAFCAIDPTGKQSRGTFKQSHAAIAQWIETWNERFPNAEICICIETTRGAVINALMEFSQVRIFPVNPSALASYRKAFAHGGGKNDAVDARLILQFLLHYRKELRPLINNSAQTRELEFLTVHRRSLVDERVGLANRLQAHLKCYFPAILELEPARAYCEFIVKLLQKYPTLEKAQAAGKEKLRKFFYAIAATEKIEKRIEVLLSAKPLTTDKIVISTAARLCQSIARQIDVLNQAIKGYDSEIKRLVKQHPAYSIVKDLPGASYKTHARIIASLGDDRQRYTSTEALQAAAGIAPLTIQSGNSCIVAARWAATLYIKQTFHEYAGLSIRKCAWAKAYYDEQLARGKSAQMAKRALAFKWIRIIYRCWQTGQPYNEAHYIQRLHATSSPLAKQLIA